VRGRGEVRFAGPDAIPASVALRMVGVATVAIALLPGHAEAQTFQGRVIDARDERAVATALVRLVDSEGEALAVSIADSAGFYSIEAPEPGMDSEPSRRHCSTPRSPTGCTRSTSS